LFPAEGATTPLVATSPGRYPPAVIPAKAGTQLFAFLLRDWPRLSGQLDDIGALRQIAAIDSPQ
jgi:hypothetical protein